MENDSLDSEVENVSVTTQLEDTEKSKKVMEDKSQYSELENALVNATHLENTEKSKEVKGQLAASKYVNLRKKLLLFL